MLEVGIPDRLEPFVAEALVAATRHDSLQHPVQGQS